MPELGDIGPAEVPTVDRIQQVCPTLDIVLGGLGSPSISSRLTAHLVQEVSRQLDGLGYPRMTTAAAQVLQGEYGSTATYSATDGVERYLNLCEQVCSSLPTVPISSGLE